MFQRVTMEHGLSHPAVTEICQDSSGFMWFGAFSGLNRFDGREVRTTDMPTVHALCADKLGNLWIGTATGNQDLRRLSAARDTFVNYDFVGVRAISCDADSVLWIGDATGLYRLNPKDGRIVRMGKEAMADSGVTSMAFDNRDNIWLLTRISILCFNRRSQSSRFISRREEGTQTSVAVAPDGTVWISGGPSGEVCTIDPVTLHLSEVIKNGEKLFAASLAIDSSGKVYIGTWGLGLNVFNPASGSWETYDHSDSDPQSLGDGAVNCIVVDRTGNLWLGTSDGVSWAARWGKGFRRISASTLNEKTSPAEIQSVVEDVEHNLWFGTFGGLKKWDRKRSTVTAVKSVPEQISSLSMIGGGKLWIGLARGNGIVQLDIKKKNVDNTKVVILPEINERVTAMFCDGDTAMWLGCSRSKLFRYDLKTGRIVKYQYETPQQLFPGRVAFAGEDCARMIYRDRAGNLWIATRFGILSLDERTRKFRRYVHSAEDLKSFSENTWCMHEDTKGRFWVGNDLGLDLFDRSEGVFHQVVHASRRLAGKTVVGIAEDRSGSLWLQTDGKLLRYNHESREIKEYGPRAGFPLTHVGLFFLYGTHACLATRSGEIVLGIRNGLVLFRPEEVRDNPVPPTVEITGVEILGQSRSRSEKIPELFALPEQPVQVGAEHNSIMITFAGLEYTMPGRIKYAIRLDPTDRTWADIGSQNFVRFFNLNPGKYRLRVKATNGDGAWGLREASYRFEVLPPWWRTTIAYLFYALAVIGMGYSGWKLQARRLRTRHQFEMSRFRAEKLQEVDEMKSRFFTNISHEFRTPLTLILGPVRQLAESIRDEKVKEELAMVHRNARKLLNLVNELLDISKLEAGSMELHAVPTDVSRLLRAAVLSFASYAERKGIELACVPEDQTIIAPVDKDKFDKIINNLLSNAFKFTPEGGRIEVRTEKTDGLLNIRVSDTGIGIPIEKIGRIFDRFYQVNGTHTSEQEGTGIGLSLTKELVELHGGKIDVESEEGRGTTFILALPLTEDRGRPTPACDSTKVREARAHFDEEPDSIGAPSALNPPDVLADSGLPVVVVIEDNADVRYYVRRNLEREYRVVEAVNGEEGWTKCVATMPDIVISDVMMPKLDGFQLCKRLKTDERTSHIPVILLTAKATTKDKVDGFGLGADEYIMKPFEPEELTARIKNLIVQRERLHDHFRRNGIIEVDQIKVTSVDQKFLRKTFDIINENISNASFSVELLADRCGVSRSVLHRKMVALTGDPPVEMISRMRLARAAQLIETRAASISEIAYDVGFNNPAYFSECFKKQYGVSPSAYSANYAHR